MGVLDVANALRQWRRWLPVRRRPWAIGKTEAADARRLADAERRSGGVPDGCAWLDDRTVDDLDLALVFRAIDRTVTPTGAQVLWRWLAAPAIRVDVLAARERSLARLAARPARPDARVPQLSTGAGAITARGIVHPAIAGAVGNDVVLSPALIVTGSNMSGKSTFLRAIAINAICAQSIHTTFGSWSAALFRVFSVMRVVDATADGVSTYAVEVAAVGTLVEAAAKRDHGPPALFVIDEPFSGTNPVLRVPIVVSVLEYLSERDVVVAATHDLEVAAQLDARFARGYFFEPEHRGTRFDYKLRQGVSPASNALALLVVAGYPPEIVAAVERRAGVSWGEPVLPGPR